jgi:hypothetical protein
MRPFKGPKHQGGWIGIAAAVVGGMASSAAKQSSDNRKNKQDYANSSDLSTLNFEQNKWLQEESHKWNLEDYQRQQNYKEDAIAGFRQYAGPNYADPKGQWQAPPPRTDTTADQQYLAPVDVNGNPYIIDPRTGKPQLGADATPGTLRQFQGAA